MDIESVKKALADYDGPPLSLMEVCGTHTAAVSENGIPSLLSKKIRLISGPGCPVCVTAAEYIDRLCRLSMERDCCVVTFGDLIRVPGSSSSLQECISAGGRVKMVYSPFEILNLAKNNSGTMFVFAAVGFETTTPIYAVLIDKIIAQGIKNIKFLTALKTMPRAIDYLCRRDGRISGFIAPGNVSVITGADEYTPIAEKYGIPFVVSGFGGEELLASIYALTRLAGSGRVLNLYKYAVTDKGNTAAKKIISRYFEPCNAFWRGMGIIPDSGMALKKEYSVYDAGSRGLCRDTPLDAGCRCGEIITGALPPGKCPRFGKSCTPENPCGACMVSSEGACFNYYINNRG